MTDIYTISAGPAPLGTPTERPPTLQSKDRPINFHTMSGASTPSLASMSSASTFGSISRPIPRPAMLNLTRNVLESMMSDMKLRSADVSSYMSAFRDGASTTPVDQSMALPTFECKAMRPESNAAVNEILLDVSDLHSRAEKGDLTSADCPALTGAEMISGRLLLADDSRTETLLLSLAARKISENSKLQQAIELATMASSEGDGGSEA
ncbi:hypothetical protein EHS25_009896 [Saitozyma podzolica]|uniref:Uncharacterized protein n=1 Tax=Saitozyma podzolica TaxID=1890683 RepID=A0A427YI16_9TREE|nr:hypothetical protein EHS25_009896 [Saitozyma podzolica]